MKKLLIICLLGCHTQPSNNYSAYLSPELSDIIRTETIENFGKWELAAAQYDLHFTIVDDYESCNDYCFSYYDASYKELNTSPGTTYVGWTHCTSYDCTQGTIYLDDQLTDDNEQRTMIAHEIGHSLGLVHTGPGTLMFPGYGKGQPNAITCGDIEQYASVRGYKIVFCDGNVEIAPLSK